MSVNSDLVGLLAAGAELLLIIVYTKKGQVQGFVKEVSSLIAMLAAALSLAGILRIYTGLHSGNVLGTASGLALVVVIALVYSVLRLFLVSAGLISKLPVIHTLDGILGLAAGFVESLLILYIVESLAPFFFGIRLELITKGLPAAAGLIRMLAAGAGQ